MKQLQLQAVDVDRRPVGEPIVVPFSPTELSFTKGANYAEVAIPGLELPLLQFVRGEAETISLELFLDASAGTTSVTELARKLYKLATISPEHHSPPLVTLSWGSGFPGPSLGSSNEAENSFTAVVLSVTRRFTYFAADGTPLRAVVTLSLKQFLTLAEQVTALNLQSADHTRIHVVQQGETLPLIAFDAYADAGAWPVIATHNNLSAVRDLRPGTRLELPPLGVGP
ncbi:hypothetical protein OK351_03455 [Glutamicibacter sp. MNS18]|uniref:CIS tube protein n=1 Tax=Glutamicibacter sp. MNS18 TaxID=2989817 RepID=UPI00223568CE|nr:hypothetical protein [Glutamicibacter sp. MNS18]MCW4464563.1 hypothetical protein [Glutamicibacter sp. MNS18]